MSVTPSAGYKRCLLVILLCMNCFTAVDRAALGVMLEGIKSGFALTDTQAGLLTGLSFTLFYSFAGIPLARWADRGNRVMILAITAGLGSVALALSALARDFPQFLGARVFVAVGEAGFLPAALSLLSDYFPRGERPRAMGIFLQGGALAIFFGIFVAGWMNQFYGWRVTFVALAIPGIVLALLARRMLVDPRPAPGGLIPRTRAQPAAPSGGDVASGPVRRATVREVGRALWSSRTFRHVVLCNSLMCFFNSGIAQWQPAFFERSYGLRTGELGTWLAAIYIVGWMIGTYLGGAWASRYAANDERLQLRVMAIAYASLTGISACIYLSPTQYGAFVFAALWSLIGTMAGAPLFATIQSLVPPSARAMAMTLVLFLGNLIGLGLGPLLAGFLSELLRPSAGSDSLRYALLALSPGYLLAAWYLWRASKTVLEDLAAREHCALGEGDCESGGSAGATGVSVAG
jgi:MFS family permease